MMMTTKIRELTFDGAPTQDIRRAAISAGHDNALRRRHSQGHARRHHARRSLPRRQDGPRSAIQPHGRQTSVGCGTMAKPQTALERLEARSRLTRQLADELAVA